MKKVVCISYLSIMMPFVAVGQFAQQDVSVEGEVYELDAMLIEARRPANEHPAASFSSPVTALRFQPSVDLQSRGFAEAQTDVTVRGGIFENTGFRVGALNLFDPQTGHYFAELPIDPVLISLPQLYTGDVNALRGFNSTVATVAYSWNPVHENTGLVELGVGTDALFFQRVVASAAITDRLFIQATTAHSEGDGTVPFGDHEFQRHGLRLQYVQGGGQSDLYFGFQHKQYGWPGMYTGSAGFPREWEDYRTLILVLNHLHAYEGGWWQAGAYFRRLEDDYDLDRNDPALYGLLYQHETEAYSAAIEGEHSISDSLAVEWRAELLADTIESTELVHAGFSSRNYGKVIVLPRYTLQLDGGIVRLGAGLSADWSNKNRDSISPILSAEYRTTDEQLRVYANHARTTQVPGYTAIASSPAPGAFSGNALLDREVSNHYEVGAAWSPGNWHFQSAVFFREDHNLVDWTFDIQQPGTFRKANPVDLDTWGVELLASYALKDPSLRVALSYAWLHKDSAYLDPAVDGSFYALNFPEHRATLSLIWMPIEVLALAVDAELRQQERNVRRMSDRDAFLLSASLTWKVSQIQGLELALVGDNLTNTGFQEFPGVPADGRRAALRATYSW